MPGKDNIGNAAAKFMKDLSFKAERLHKVRKDLATREERYARETESLFQEESNLKADLLSGLKLVNLASVRVRAGDTFFISKRSAFAFSNIKSLETWAVKNRLIKVDNELVKQKLKKIDTTKGLRLPSFVERTEVETISVRHNEPKGKKKK